MNAFEQQFFAAILIGGFIAAPIASAVLLRVPAPYGRHARPGWGPEMPRQLGWVLMELPAAAVFALFFLAGTGADVSTVWIFLLLWQLHYLHRSLVYPFRLKSRGKTNPVLIVGLAVAFNFCNGYLNGRYLGLHADRYTAAWLRDPRFIIGLGLFVLGFALNRHSDGILLRLRGPGETDYKIPLGGAFRLVSCPNYLGELLEWTGWAVLTWSLPGLLFALWTAANLIPRARTHHQWYKEKFPKYPPQRRIILPYLY